MNPLTNQVLSSLTQQTDDIISRAGRKQNSSQPIAKEDRKSIDNKIRALGVSSAKIEEFLEEEPQYSRKRYKAALLNYSQKLFELKKETESLSVSPLAYAYLQRLTTQANKINHIFQEQILPISKTKSWEKTTFINDKKMQSQLLPMEELALQIGKPGRLPSSILNQLTFELNLDKYIEFFLTHFSGDPQEIFKAFKETYKWDSWSPILQEKFEACLSSGFKYYAQISLLLEGDMICLNPDYLRSINLLENIRYSDLTIDEWRFASSDFEDNFVNKMSLIAPESLNWEQPTLACFERKIADKLEEALMSKIFPASYGKVRELMNTKPPSLSLILAARSYTLSYREEAIYDAVDAAKGAYTIREEITIDSSENEEITENIIQMPWHALERLLDQVCLLKLNPSPYTDFSQIQREIVTLIQTPPLNSQAILHFFQQQSHQNMTVVKEFMSKIDWSQIRFLSGDLSSQQIRAINRYTSDYLLVNAFLRNEFWSKNFNKPDEIRANLPNEAIQSIWDKFIEDPVLNSISAIVQAASIQGALVIAFKESPCNKDVVYRSINFSSQQKLMEALKGYIPEDLDVTQLVEGEFKEFCISFQEKSLISSSEDKSIVNTRKIGGINFGGEWMMTFEYYNVSSQQAVLVESFTDREQKEVLFKIGLKGIVSGIIKNRKGAYTLMCFLLCNSE